MSIATMQDLEEKVLSIFDANSGFNRQTIQKQLYDFMETPQAWEASIQLCQSNGGNWQVKYFVMNILYTKIKRNLSQLNSQQLDQFPDILLDILRKTIDLNTHSTAVPVTKAFVDRILLSLAAYSVRNLNSLNHIFGSCLQIIECGCNNKNIDLTIIGLELLHAIPVELIEMNTTTTTNNNSNNNNSVDIVNYLIEHQSKINPILNAAYNITSPLSSSLGIVILKVVNSWSCFTFTLASLYCENVNADIMNSVIIPALNSRQKGILKEAFLALKASLSPDKDLILHPALFSQHNTIQTQLTQNAVKLLVNTLGNAWQSISFLFDSNKDPEDDLASVEFCNLLCMMAEEDAEALCDKDSFSISYFEHVLAITQIKPRRLGVLLFDVWLLVQDIPVQSRHPFVAQEVFFRLLQILIEQCAYPTGFKSWDDVDIDVDDEDDFLEFRSNKSGVQDVLLCCFYALEESFFSLLGQHLQLDIIMNDWTKFEVVLFILNMTMTSDMKSTIKSQSRKSIIALEFTNQCLDCLLNMSSRSRGPMSEQLVHTAASFIGTCSWILADNKYQCSNGDLLVNKFIPCIGFAFDNVHISMPASKAILQLCVHGSHLIRGQTTLVENLMSSSSTIIKNIDTDPDAMAIIVEGLTRCMVCPESTYDLAFNSMCFIGHVLTTELQQACEAVVQTNNMQQIVRVISILNAIGQMVRFCDQPPTSAANMIDDNTKHVLFPLCESLWPKLRAMLDVPTLMDHDGVIESLCNVYCRFVASAMHLVITEVPNLVKVMISIFEEKQAAPPLIFITGIVEQLSYNCNLETMNFLSSMVNNVVHIFGICIDNQTVTNNTNIKLDPEVVENFFKLIYIILLQLPGAIANLSDLQKLSHLCHQCLMLYSEKTAVRSILQCIQALFYPITQKTREYLPSFHNAMIIHTNAFVNYLFSAIGGGLTSTLWPQVIETLFCILAGIQSPVQGGDVVQMKTEWIKVGLETINIPAIMIPSVGDALLQSVSDINTTAIMEIQSHKQAFKGILQDLGKVATGEAAPDLLQAYQNRQSTYVLE